MPELPEVETIKRSLQKAIVGKKIKDIEVRKPKIFQGDKKDVIGRKIEGIERRGKVLKKFKPEKYKPEDCVAQAKKFSKNRFKQEIREFVDSKLEIKKVKV